MEGSYGWLNVQLDEGRRRSLRRSKLVENFQHSAFRQGPGEGPLCGLAAHFIGMQRGGGPSIS